MNYSQDSIYKNNLRLLSKKNQQLAVALRFIRIPSHVRIFRAKNQLYTAEVKVSSDCSRLLHSAIDPLEEAKCWAQIQNIATESIALLGFGMGYPALALLDKGFTGKIYIVEKDIGIFKLAVIHCDLAKIFTTDNVDFFIGKDADSFSIIINKITNLSYKTYYPAAALHPKFYKDVRLDLDKIIFEQHLISDPQCSKGIKELLQTMNE